jgi:DNA polymerase
MSIQERLVKFPVSDSIWAAYALDQEINDRGVMVDMTLVKNAIAADARSKA